MSAQIIPLDHPGATAEEWTHFDLILGLTADLLPVVSNPHAAISPASKMQALGKTPSRYNQQRQVAGIAQWTSHVATPADIKRWSRERDYGICIQTRNVRALDVDIDNGSVEVDQFAAEVHVAVDKLLGVELPTRRRLGSSKFLLAFQLEGDYTKRILRTAHGAVEFLANGQQFIACGTHPSGQRYQWVGGLPDTIPTLTPEQFEALWRELEERFAIEPSTERNASSKATKLQEAASNDETAQRLHSLGLVLGTERDGRLHIECPFKSEHTTESAVSATSYFPANTGGYARGHFKCLHAHCEHRTDDEFREALGLSNPADDFDVVGGPGDGASAAPARFQLVQAADFASRTPLAWWVKGILPDADLGVVFGEPGSGKSFWTFDLVASIARGEPWCGKRVRKTRVVYVVAEGAAGFQNRLIAYARAHDVELADIDLYVLGDQPNFMLASDVRALIEAINALGSVGVVVIDTLAQVTPGADENGGKDMGRVLGHCRQLKKHTGAMVLLIAHSGKDATKGVRGWSGIKAAMDAQVEIVRSEDARVAVLDKLKDGADRAEFGFKLQTVVMGVDADGDEVTSCVVEHVEGGAGVLRARGPKGTNEKMVMRAVRDSMGLAGEAPHANDVIEAAVALLDPPPEGKRDRRREHIVRAMDGLVADGALRRVEGGKLEVVA